jgi:hypothetical protein
MALVALDNGAHHVPPRYGHLAISDWDLVRQLRARDGEMPTKAPSHWTNGRCKYEAFYRPGACPWCLMLRPAKAA